MTSVSSFGLRILHLLFVLPLVSLSAGFALAQDQNQTLDKDTARMWPVQINTQQPAPVTIVRAFPNLQIKRPIFATFIPDGSKRLAVISQYGTVLAFPNDPSVEEPSEL